MTKAQIDRLGNRLRDGSPSDDDLRLLDAYRRSFLPAYEEVTSRIRSSLALEPSGRPAKTIASISDKLRRETIRLSQIQDIAGCRIVVDGGLEEQDQVTSRLQQLFSEAAIVDRRVHPSHGYRAVHVIVNLQGRLVEVQVRTLLQHVWAELCEKIDDAYPGTKYGRGHSEITSSLLGSSRNGHAIELLERDAHVFDRKIDELPGGPEAEELRVRLEALKRSVSSARAELIATVDLLRREWDSLEG